MTLTVPAVVASVVVVVLEGFAVGLLVGLSVTGRSVGVLDGLAVGLPDGSLDGLAVGALVSGTDGVFDGLVVGPRTGMGVLPLLATASREFLTCKKGALRSLKSAPLSTR